MSKKEGKNKMVDWFSFDDGMDFWTGNLKSPPMADINKIRVDSQANAIALQLIKLLQAQINLKERFPSIEKRLEELTVQKGLKLIHLYRIEKPASEKIIRKLLEVFFNYLEEFGFSPWYDRTLADKFMRSWYGKGL